MREFDEVVRVIPRRLQDEGFCVLGDMDLERMLEDSLGVHGRRYRVLCTCNPQIVRRALAVEPSVGPLLPCNVAIYEGDQGETVVEMMNPIQSMTGDHHEDVHRAAEEAHRRLARVLALL